MVGVRIGVGVGVRARARARGLLEQRHVSGPAALHDGGHVGGGELQLG